MGILENELHVAAQALQPRAAGGAKILAEKRHGAGVGLEEPEDQPRQRRLSAARFADDAERLFRRDAERDVVHRADPGVRSQQQPRADREMLPQPTHREQRGAHIRISIASRSPSESRLNAIDVRKMATPGSAGTQAFT